MKVAIVGSGAAAAAALHTLFQLRPTAQAVVFEVGDRPPPEPAHPPAPPEEWVRGVYDGVYSELKSRHGYRLLPSKTHFGEACPTERVGGKKRFFRVESFGGQMNFWGSCALPFQDAELKGWPVTAAELAPYYRAMADVIGVTGERDALNRYFPEDYANRPPIRMLPGAARLRDSVNAHPARGGYELCAGTPRVAVETRPNVRGSCIYCGECCAGCFQGTVYSSRATLDPLMHARNVPVVAGRVMRVDSQRRAVAVARPEGLEWHEGFDRIFLCAGCVGTTEIVMRSLGLREGPIMVDSAIAEVPILNFGGAGSRDDHRRYFGLSQLLVACVPRDPGDEYAQLQIYPNLDYLWRSAVPEWAWPAFRPLVAFSRDRVLVGRLCTHSKDGFAYSVRLNDEDRLEFADVGRPNRDAVRKIFRSLRSSINHDRFFMYPGPPVWAGTSAHLAGTLPYGGSLVDVQRDGTVMPGVHLCDSSCFPHAPAVSPTFTLMANASRTVTEALT